MAEVEIVGCVLTNEDSWVYLLHREDHRQWQLPGGRRLANGDNVLETPESAAIRHLDEELMVEAIPEAIRMLGGTAFRQGGVGYNATWVGVNRYYGDPMCMDWNNYDQGEFVNLHRHNIRRTLSPNVQQLVNQITMGDVELLPRVRVQ